MPNSSIKQRNKDVVSPDQGDIEQFKLDVADNIEKLGMDANIQRQGDDFIRDIAKYKYAYNFTWMGMPIIQVPQDIIAMQELIWKIRPDTIVEAGVARGGSLVFYASMMEMMGISDGKVIGVDIDIRPHNLNAIKQHPMHDRIHLVEGSSTAPTTVDRVRELIGSSKCTMVCLDSMHTHAHVLEELRLYSPFVTSGSYLVVFDTSIEFMPKNFYPDRPWDKGNNPLTAVREFLKEAPDFETDESIPNKLVITVARGGYLKRK